MNLTTRFFFEAKEKLKMTLVAHGKVAAVSRGVLSGREVVVTLLVFPTSIAEEAFSGITGTAARQEG
jgi:hypothetical protein